MPKRSVHFILNPVSGSGQNKLNVKSIFSVLNTKNYDFKLKISERPGDVCQLTKLSIQGEVVKIEGKGACSLFQWKNIYISIS